MVSTSVSATPIAGRSVSLSMTPVLGAMFAIKISSPCVYAILTGTSASRLTNSLNDDGVSFVSVFPHEKPRLQMLPVGASPHSLVHPEERSLQHRRAFALASPSSTARSIPHINALEKSTIAKMMFIETPATKTSACAHLLFPVNERA